MNPVTNTGKPGGQSKTPQDINPRFVAQIPGMNENFAIAL